MVSARLPHLYPFMHRSRCAQLRIPGLIYFVVAFVANLIATVFMLVHLNQIMAIIFNVPAVVASTVSYPQALLYILGLAGINFVIPDRRWSYYQAAEQVRAYGRGDVVGCS